MPKLLTVDGLIVRRKELEHMIARAGNLEKALMPGAQAIQKLIDDSFRKSRSPDGTPWEPLKESTLARRRKGKSKRFKAKGKPLIDTGRLRSSVFARAKKREIVFGTNVEYAGPHQFGTDKAGRKRNTRIPRRAFMPVNVVGNVTTLMADGPAGKTIEKIRKTLMRYIKDGRT